MLAEEPFSVWLPTRRYDDDEDHIGNRKEGYEAWIVTPSPDGSRLDEYDPLSVRAVERRPYFISKIASPLFMQPGDRFHRSWLLRGRRIAATTDAWGYEMPYEEGGSTGVRLVCKTSVLKQVLETTDVDLLLLIKLHRYQSGEPGYRSSKFSNTVAVLRVKRTLAFEYFEGAVNQIQQPDW